MITNILADPYARMRAFGVESVLDPGRPAAAKTGTTTDWRDNWTIGYTPDRAVGVWVGNADGTPMKAISGVTGAGPVWRAVVQAAHHDIPIHPFLRPNGILEAEICADSGLLPGPHCPATRHEIFMAGTVPTTPDNTHVAVRIDPKLGCQAQSSYPANQTTMQIFRILPPEAELWAIDAGIPRIPRKACPTAQPSSNPNPSNQGPALQPKDELGLMTPARGATYTLSPNVPRERQRIEIAAHGGLTTNELTILIDGAAVAHFTEPPYRTFWTLTPGHHQLVIRARDRNGQQNETSPVEIVVE
jgi:membrane carboxypeptidase/penicillin-binding protein PbpC